MEFLLFLIAAGSLAANVMLGVTLARGLASYERAIRDYQREVVSLVVTLFNKKSGGRPPEGGDVV